MAMAACYPTYDMSLSNSQSMSHHHRQSHHVSMQQQSSSRPTSQSVGHQQTQQSPRTQQQPLKDYSIPLHVDCSVEYELPNQAKPPVGARVEPLLMIHPCYFRKVESQRRSPFINNMPSSSARNTNVTISQSNMTAVSTSTAYVSSSRHSNVPAVALSAPASGKTHSNTAHMMANQNVISTHQNQMQQKQQKQHMIHQQNQQQQSTQQQNHHQNLQAQLDEYVQRQMTHISQQAQYPNEHQQQQQHQQQSNSQYNMPAPHQHNQMQSSGEWDRYMNVSNAPLMGKVNIPNQNAYKKNGKRHLTATCANSYYGHLDGGLPNNIIRWDEKTAMAAIPRDFQSGPESIPSSVQHRQHQLSMKETIAPSTAMNTGSMYRGASSQQAVLMSGKRDRDPMLSGGCIYNSSNNSNNNLNTDVNNLASSGLWEPIQKSPMAAIPNNNYQAGPDSIPNNSHSSNSNNNKTNSNSGMAHRQPSGTTVIHHSQYPQQQQMQHIHQNEKCIASNNNSGNNNVITVKYRQYRNSHRTHPYMMSNAPSVNTVLSGVSSYFSQLNAPFPQIQQVSCYNV